MTNQLPFAVGDNVEIDDGSLTVHVMEIYPSPLGQSVKFKVTDAPISRLIGHIHTQGIDEFLVRVTGDDPDKTMQLTL